MQRVKKPIWKVPQWDPFVYENDAYSTDLIDMDSSDDELSGTTKKTLEIGMSEVNETPTKSNLEKKLLQQQVYSKELFANVESHRNIDVSTSCPVGNGYADDFSSEKFQSSNKLKIREKPMQSQSREFEKAPILDFTSTAPIYHGEKIDKCYSDDGTKLMKIAPSSNFVKHFASKKHDVSNQRPPLSTILRVKSTEYPSRVQSCPDEEIDRNMTVTPVGNSTEDDFNPLSI